ncbi:hypothetical protein [Thiobaca trueperi]|nr:hypothetical protein [Thiobaca trueperi]
MGLAATRAVAAQQAKIDQILAVILGGFARQRTGQHRLDIICSLP